MFVQTDLDYRKQWDDSAIQLELIESDPSKGSNSQIIYWEVLWPVRIQIVIFYRKSIQIHLKLNYHFITKH